jgi:hypothetical protein
MRNITSHPTTQNIVMPHETLYDLSVVAKHINALFDDNAA